LLGPAGPGPEGTCFGLVHAAVRRRKPVIIVHAGAAGWLPGALAAVCHESGAPLQAAGPGGALGFGSPRYDPLRGAAPSRAVALTMAMIDWGGLPTARRRGCAAYLAALFAVRAAGAAVPGQPSLADALTMLSPAALRDRLRLVPPDHPQRADLAGRVAAVTAQAEADPAPLATVTGQLSRLLTAPAGRWLGADGPPFSLAQVLRDRAVYLIDLGLAGPFAAMLARLLVVDLLGLCADLRAVGVAGDGLVVLHPAELTGRAALVELVAWGGQAGMGVVLSTTQPQAAVSLAGHVGVLAVHQVSDPALAAALAAQMGWPGVSRSPAASPSAPASGRRAPPVPGAGVSPESLLDLRSDEFTLLVRGGPYTRIQPRCRAVPARLPGGAP
jgi:hypothetical protein